ncbi:MAG: transketolase [Phycisphaerales bacterium]|jgi:transketolase|nr:transketolase [Phycisphaerales bacterium]MBT7171478.1 transketolase [Phycisphaerales bacterium]
MTYQRDALPADLAGSIANTIRFLSADAIQAANSGHPGLPMGCADIATVLLSRFLRVDPADPTWFNRDRFILSAGHGSMLVYSMLHMLGYVSLDDIKQFRQFESLTPGHPELGDVPGVDMTTGPLGAGFSTAAGLSIAERMLAERFSSDVIDHYTYVLMGDGCQMEGVTQEAASLAGHLGLGRMIAIYDDNEISIEGDTDLAFTENVNARYEAMGWHVQDIDGHDHDAIAAAILAAQEETARPSLIVAHTTIGKGAPTLAGSEASHGAPLGTDEIIAGKAAIGWSEETFQVPAEVEAWAATLRESLSPVRASWNAAMATYTAADPTKAAELGRLIKGELPANWEDARPSYDADEKGIATRASGGKVLNAFAAVIDELVGGSADLAPSCKTEMTAGNNAGFVAPGSFAGRNIHFGVREHAMGNALNGLALHGLVPLGSTFMVFSDYMRPPIRLAALMGLGSIFVFTHDSFYVGEDGPTHQPIEHVAALRSIPNLHVLRPGDANEVAYAWQHAIARRQGPSTLALTRQNLPTLDRTVYASAEGTLKGGYVLETDADNEYTLVASGSELALAADAAKLLRETGKTVRVVSMPCLDAFEEQSAEYQSQVLEGQKVVVIEAGIEQGWGRLLGRDGLFIGMDDFGKCGPCATLAEHYGLTAPKVAHTILEYFAN